jgi:hypothetical protein
LNAFGLGYEIVDVTASGNGNGNGTESEKVLGCVYECVND